MILPAILLHRYEKKKSRCKNRQKNDSAEKSRKKRCHKNEHGSGKHNDISTIFAFSKKYTT